ncbi:MAG: aldehyde ferredoxin oxidoreductase family protein [Candidatus Heimdallarchaeum endolithica]|uniref:Aldehyde ferredoxin oxidoreductase family protein n=1 Tax=Candidatus Heimdallarchaeum endolithica TaxID=2876572 RepID=A0A9Y1BRM5_9ARCH|nr:MAG: aldehyde ferredoxin oxidoreductase family protein [Candidatus Heimdallarchaeum endolithica]
MQQVLLRINLTDRTHTIENIPQEISRKFLGGTGFITYYLYKEVKPRIEPLSEENKIVIASGPLQGTVVPITGRYSIGTKSPLTGLFLDTNVGGFVGPELRFAGYDVIIIEGKAEKPVYISIIDDIISIKDASLLWGKTTHQTEDKLRELENEKSMRVISIGPAGENKVKIACVTSDRFRNAGRGGLGAVFGNKNLKAIGIKGSSKPINGNKVEFDKIRREIIKRAKTAKEHKHLLYQHGTSWLVDLANQYSQFPTKNFQSGVFDKHDKINHKALEKYKRKRRPCYKCVISCSEVIDASSFNWTDEEFIAKPEYETLGLIGGNCAIDEPETIIKANYRCNEYGLDTISTGSIIAMIMEGVEKGRIKEKEYRDIRFGNKEKLMELIDNIAYRKGIGDILAEGLVDAAKNFNTEDLAVHTKKLPYAAWDPRGKLGLGLSYATAAVGASHLRGWPSTSDIPDKSALSVIDSLIEQQDLKTLKDSLIICHFTHSISPALNIDDCHEMVEAAFDEKFEREEIINIAKRVWILKRMFNIREFKPRKAREFDKLPPRFWEPMPEGRAKGMKAFISEDDFNKSLLKLYEKRGLDEFGEPLPSTISKLNLEEI